MTENVRTQNLRDFTVQVRRVQDDAIVGPGIAVSREGRIVTCAQVVCAAGVERAMQTARMRVCTFHNCAEHFYLPCTHRSLGHAQQRAGKAYEK